MSVEFHQLRTFCAVAEEENLTRAAENLHLSAPSVSAHIKALEEYFGAKLFVRSAKGMFLTELGHSLWGEADDLLNRVERLKERIHMSVGEIGGTVRIAINNPPEIIRFNELLRALISQHPTLNIETSFGDSADNLQRLIAGKLDFCFHEGSLKHPDLGVIPLSDRKLVLIAPRKWQVDWARIKIPDLEEYPWIFMSAGCSCHVSSKKWAETHQIELKSQIGNCPNDLTTIGYVACGFGLSVVSENALEISKERDSVEVLPCFTDSVSLSFVYRKDAEPFRRSEEVVKAVREVWELGSEP